MLSHEERAYVSQLFALYQSAMKRRAMNHVSDPYDAEDIVSESWESLLNHIPTILREKSAYNIYHELR